MYLFLSYFSKICNKVPNGFADALDLSDLALVTATYSKTFFYCI